MKDGHSDEEIRKILSEYKNVCVVGASRNEEKDAHQIPLYLIKKGYNVIPVNPNSEEIFGRKCYKSIADVNEPIDIVDIFRPSADVYQIAVDAIPKHPKVIWMQEGIENEKAKELAESNGITVVYNRCMFKEHFRLFGN